MKDFFKITLGSCLGTLLVFGVIALIVTRMVIVSAKSADAAAKVKPNSVLHLTFSNQIPEQTNNIPITTFDLENESVLGLADILEAIEFAKTDDDIKGIFLEVEAPAVPLATLKSLRDGIMDFKESGKFVVSYGNFFSQKGYYLNATADDIYLNPQGVVDFAGFSAQIPFFKGMFDKLGVDYEIYKVGKFKSAIEPYSRTSMSEENRLQTREFLEDMYGVFLEDIAETRGIDVKELRKVADGYLIRKAEDAVTYKFVDELYYKDQVIDNLKERLGLDEKDKISSISIEKYHTNVKVKTPKAKDKIAVVYAEGNIVMGDGEAGSIGGEEYAKMIRRIRQNKRVKAIVLRVNSPGGSAFASEMIWRELVLAKEQDIKVVVSMGDYAASGGYYIACMADSIFAEENTLTGSIGVFGMLPIVEDLMRDKVGITFDTVKTGKYSTGITPFIKPSAEENNIMQAGVEDFYETFLKRVSDGRGMSRDSVHAVAQGRVWTGNRGVENGLVDKIGNLDAAISSAADLAGLEQYRIAEYPKTKTPIEQLVEDIIGTPTAATHAVIQEEMGEFYDYYQYIKEMKDIKGIQARMPFDIVIE